MQKSGPGWHMLKNELPNISGRGEVGEDLELQNLDVRRIRAPDEKVPEMRLEHSAPRSGPVVARHRRDAVQHDRLHRK